MEQNPMQRFQEFPRDVSGSGKKFFSFCKEIDPQVMNI